MAQVQVFGERRVHRRKTCAFAVTIGDKKSSYPALMRNISLGGALVELSQERSPRVGQQIILTIPFRLKKDRAIIRGKIDRVQSGFMGVAFVRKTDQ